MHVSPTGVVFLLALGGASACAYDTPSGPTNTTATFSMNAFNGSGVSGTARINDQPDDASTVTVELRNVPPGAHAGDVHLGSCAHQGPLLFVLNPITADSSGNGSAVTDGVPDGFLVPGYYIQYHEALDPPGDPIACADIPSPLGAPGGN